MKKCVMIMFLICLMIISVSGVFAAVERIGDIHNYKTVDYTNVYQTSRDCKKVGDDYIACFINKTSQQNIDNGLINGSSLICRSIHRGYYTSPPTRYQIWNHWCDVGEEAYLWGMACEDGWYYAHQTGASYLNPFRWWKINNTITGAQGFHFECTSYDHDPDTSSHLYCCQEAPNPVCGNWIIEDGEECDDGNSVSRDGCNATCGREFCGDNIETTEDEYCKLRGTCMINPTAFDPIGGCAYTPIISIDPGLPIGPDTGPDTDQDTYRAECEAIHPDCVWVEGPGLSGPLTPGTCTNETELEQMELAACHEKSRTECLAASESCFWDDDCDWYGLDPEECDDGNNNNNDSCKNDCTDNVCGDGVIRVGVEECDGSIDCYPDCTLIVTVLGEAYWTNKQGRVLADGEEVSKNSLINLIVKGMELTDEVIEYEIKECETMCTFTGGLVRYFDDTVAQSDEMGRITWRAGLDSTTGGLTPGKYYFVATLSDGTEKTSESIAVSDIEVNVPPVAEITGPEDGQMYFLGTDLFFNHSSYDELRRRKKVCWKQH